MAATSPAPAALDACKSMSGRPTFVFASTVVTGDAKGALRRESELAGRDAYGRSKQRELVRDSGLDA